MKVYLSFLEDILSDGGRDVKGGGQGTDAPYLWTAATRRRFQSADTSAHSTFTHLPFISCLLFNNPFLSSRLNKAFQPGPRLFKVSREKMFKPHKTAREEEMHPEREGCEAVAGNL
jgi:hypothetical protein